MLVRISIDVAFDDRVARRRTEAAASEEVLPGELLTVDVAFVAVDRLVDAELHFRIFTRNANHVVCAED